MKYRNWNGHESYQTILQQWNADMPKDFHLREDLFISQILKQEDIHRPASYVAIDETDREVGWIIVKRWNRDGIDAYRGVAWISFLYVVPSHRKQGIGRKLVTLAIDQLRLDGIHTVHVGKDMNNLFCGVPEIFGTKGFFAAMDFVEHDFSVDMHKHVTSTDLIPLRQQLNYRIRLATRTDFPKIHAFFAKNFPGRWQQEFIEYDRLGHDGSAFVIVLHDDRVIAFCRINDSRSGYNMYNTNWTATFDHLIGVGPLGVDDDYRGYGLGFDVTAEAINDAVRRDASDIIIDWTSHIEFYRKFGFDVWHRYASMTRKLSR